MPVSEAKKLANRRNAQRSTGPKSPEGKARSRQNALKHGLTGSGVALPFEDQAEITRSFTALQNELRPSNELAEKLVRRTAFLFVRLERSEKHETSETSKRVRHAVEKFDDERLAAVEELAAKIEREPATTSRRLQMSPEGIDWLLDEWEILRDELFKKGNRVYWTNNHRARFELLLGRNPADWRLGRIAILSDAVAGFFLNLEKEDGEGLEDEARADWARGELGRMIDDEMARLKDVRVNLDPKAIEQDRAEAVDRALFDTSKEAILARKYEAATERALFRTLKELRQVEDEAAQGIRSEITVDTEETCDKSALNLQEDESESSTASEAVPPTIFPLLERAKEGPNPVETAEKGVG
jgi:hypothetical protein